MKTAILSDAHGNLPALRAVITNAMRSGVRSFWYLGDAVGYGPWPYQVWEELRSLPIPQASWLAGNHEWGLLERLTRKKIQFSDTKNSSHAVGFYNHLAWPILELQRHDLQEQSTFWTHLQSLPVMSSPRPHVYLAHGAFVEDAALSLYRTHKQPPGWLDQGMLTQLDQSKMPIKMASNSGGEPHLLLTGHSHLTGIWRGRHHVRGMNWELMGRIGRFSLEESIHTPLYINVGSVGFPRDYNGCATYALIDWETNTVEIRRIPYDQTILREKMRSIPEYRVLLESNFLFECGKAYLGE